MSDGDDPIPTPHPATAVALATPRGVQVHYTLAERYKLATSFAASGLFGCKNPDQAMSLIMIAEAEGMHPAQAMAEYHIIEGVPSRKAERIAARFMMSGGKIEWRELSATRACAFFTHPQGSDIEIEWTIEMAKVAGYIKPDKPKSAWNANPRSMLRSRVWSEGCKSCYPAYALVTLSVEEAMDMEVISNTPHPEQVARDENRERVREAIDAGDRNAPVEEADTEPGLFTPRATDIDGTGFIKGAAKNDAVKQMTLALERAAAHGSDALEAQWLADAFNRKRISDNASYGLEEVFNRLRGEGPPAASGADGPPADSSVDSLDDPPPSDPATPDQERQRIDHLIAAMYDYTALSEYVAWAKGQFTIETLSTFSPEGRKEIQREHELRKAVLMEASSG